MANKNLPSNINVEPMAPTMADSTPDEPSTFRHEPLDRRIKSIRLMKVLRNNGREIQCELHNFAMDMCPPYVALSYTWSQENKKHENIKCDDQKNDKRKTIKCNGMSLQVGLNLWDFLFRYQFRANAHGQADYLWVDALSINQNNVLERNHQVALMRDIYSAATAVIVWLGENMESVETASTFFPSSEAALEHMRNDSNYCTSLSQWRSLIDFLRRPYWRRVWVVQEFVLARIITIWCGGFVLDTHGFEQLYMQKQALREFPSGLYLLIQKCPGWALFQHRALWWHNNGQERQSTFHLQQLLISFPASQSSEIHDKIYGLLGIISDATRNNHRIEPDYAKPTVEVIVDVLKHQSDEGTAPDTLARLVERLLRILEVSNVQLAMCILEQAPCLYDHLYQLATMRTKPYAPATPSGNLRFDRVSRYLIYYNWQPTKDSYRNHLVVDFLLGICGISKAELAEYVINQIPSQRQNLHRLTSHVFMSVSFKLFSQVTHWEADPLAVVPDTAESSRSFDSTRPSAFTPMGARMIGNQNEVLQLRQNRLAEVVMNLNDRVHPASRHHQATPHTFLIRRSLSNGQSLWAMLNFRETINLESLSLAVPESIRMATMSGAQASPTWTNASRCRCSTVDQPCGFGTESVCRRCKKAGSLSRFVFSAGSQYIGIIATDKTILPNDYIFVSSTVTERPLAIVLRPEGVDPHHWPVIGQAAIYRLSDFEKLAWFNETKFDDLLRASPNELRDMCLEVDGMETPWSGHDKHTSEMQGQEQFTIEVGLNLRVFRVLVQHGQFGNDFRVSIDRERCNSRETFLRQRLLTAGDTNPDSNS